LGLQPLKLDLTFPEVSFHPVELPEKIVVPERSPELAVGDRLQSDLLLLADHLLDLAVLDGRELLGSELAALALGACLLESGRPQETADVISAKRRLGAWHELSSAAVVSGFPRAQWPRLRPWRAFFHAPHRAGDI